MTYRISFFELRTRKPLKYRAIQLRVLSDTSICSVVAEMKWIVSEFLCRCSSKTAINFSSISIHIARILSSSEIGNSKCRKKVTSSGVLILQIRHLVAPGHNGILGTSGRGSPFFFDISLLILGQESATVCLTNGGL